MTVPMPSIIVFSRRYLAVNQIIREREKEFVPGPTCLHAPQKAPAFCRAPIIDAPAQTKTVVTSP